MPRVSFLSPFTEEMPRVEKIKGLDNGVLSKPGKKVRLGSFADLVADGEDPDGLMVQTPAGTSRQDRKQFNSMRARPRTRWDNPGGEGWDGDMSGI